jgi:hypothetical protein
LDEVENPSILKTGQLDPNTVSDQPLAAAPYRASDLVQWHLADDATDPLDIRCRGSNGHGLAVGDVVF